MSTSINFAMGRKPFCINPPDGIRCSVVRPIVEAEALDSKAWQGQVEAVLEPPGSGPSLSKLATGKRQAVILVGDLTLPGPYDRLLPVIRDKLVDAGIRPSRISFLCCPGECDAVLGLAPIRRYGEQITGDHEVRNWEAPDDDKAGMDPLFARADLRIAVLPALADSRPIIENKDRVDFVITFHPGASSRQEIHQLFAGEPAEAFAHIWPKAGPSPLGEETLPEDVWMISGGGDPSDHTLEEALASLKPRSGIPIRDKRPLFKTVVLAFDGLGGLGSAPFSLALWRALEEAEIRLADPSQPHPQASSSEKEPWYPEVAIHDAILESQFILFSPGLAEHPDWEDLCERLNALPRISRRCVAIAEETELWECLRGFHGNEYHLLVEPLGWRGLFV